MVGVWPPKDMMEFARLYQEWVGKLLMKREFLVVRVYLLVLFERDNNSGQRTRFGLFSSLRSTSKLQ